MCVLLVGAVGAVPVQGAPTPKAWVGCFSDPPGARVLAGHPMSQDAWEKGVTPCRVPIYDAAPTPRDIRFTLVKPGYEPYTTVISVKEGDEIRVVATLSARRMMAYVSDSKLVVANADGSAPTEVAALAEPTSWHAPAWFPDSRSLCVMSGGDLARWTPDGKPLGKLADAATTAAALGIKQPVELGGSAVLGSGRWVAYAATWAGGRAAAVLLAAVTGGSSPEVLGADARRVAASPSADLVAVEQATGVRLLSITEQSTAEEIRFIPGARDVAWSNDGSRIAFVADGELYIGDARQADVIQVTNSEKSGPSNVIWSQDDRLLAITVPRQSGRRTRWDEIWIVHAPGVYGEPALVADGRGHPHSSQLAPVAFVPYSTRLAYRAGVPPVHRTYVVDLAAPGSPQVLLFGSSLPSWSRPTTEDVGPVPGIGKSRLPPDTGLLPFGGAVGVDGDGP